MLYQKQILKTKKKHTYKTTAVRNQTPTPTWTPPTCHSAITTFTHGFNYHTKGNAEDSGTSA
jgi:hypothetical protein